MIHIMIDIMAHTRRMESRAKDKAKVFMTGRSQAVRIPAEYRFHSPEVSIRRDPASGDIILSEGPGTWADIFAALDATGVRDGFTVERDTRPAEERPALDAFFSGKQQPRARKK
jgi:antitoxin VapB